MKKEDVVKFAAAAGINAEHDTLCRHGGWVEPLERFASLVAAHEREECARVAQDAISRYWPAFPEAAGACHAVARLIDQRGKD